VTQAISETLTVVTLRLVPLWDAAPSILPTIPPVVNSVHLDIGGLGYDN
jgi:hypothetical protein